jgi:3-keto-5-aminohexanoate cleavage enzyme
MSIRSDDAVIIEVAINGANQSAPRLPEEIATCAAGCFDIGAAIVHNHIDFFDTGEVAAARYLEGWEPVLAAQPDALLYPTINGIGAVEERYSHIAALAQSGVLRIGVSDPGSVNLGPRFAYVNSGSDIDYQLELCERFGLVPTLAIFEPGFLRAALSYWRAGRLPGGTMLRFYFGGEGPEAGGGFWFGLPPTRASLDAYLAMLDGCSLPWSVSVLGGDLFASELPELALERGGHLRVGLEDYAGDPVTNEDLVTTAVALAEKAGRKPASCAETAEMLGLKGAAQ